MKKIVILVTMFISFLIGFCYGELSNISSINSTYLNPLITPASCDEIITGTLYRGNYGVLVDEFYNRGTNDIYIQGVGFSTNGRNGTDSNPLCLVNRSLYNPTGTTSNDYRLMTFNRNYLSSINRRIRPGQRVRHLTTSQEYGHGREFGPWSLSGTYTNTQLPGSFTFTNPNFRNPGNTPSTVATGNNYDCEFKIGTVYDSDDNVSTVPDNRMLIECARYQIRWCGDGLLTNGEICDYNDTTHQGWGTLGCSNSCEALNPVSPGGGTSTPTGGGGGGNIYSSPPTGGGTPTGPTGPTNPTDGTLFADTSSCNYIDPPSIQIGEYLPIWWKLKGDIWANSCNSGNVGKYNPGSAICNFTINNGKNQTLNFQRNCFGEDLWGSLGNAYMSERSSIPSFDGRTLQMISSVNFDSLGEYNINLHKINYQLCDGTKWINGTYEGTICSMSFAVTRPYLLQKGTNISTVNNDILGNFYNLNGDKIFQSSELKNIAISAYTGGNDMKYILNDFISKYEKLAVKNTLSLPELGLTNLKKLSDRNIYFIDAGGGTISLKPNATLAQPLTLIVKNGNLRIKDNLFGFGMYIVPNGTVMFDLSNCDSKQIIEGIIISNSYDTNQIINNNSSSNNWCSDGRLNIKGTIKGNNITSLWSKRRSILLDFFNSSISRVNKIFDGSSLLIETNTKLWLSLPPGANELIDSLQIDKK